MFLLPTPLNKITNVITEKYKINLFLKRDDLIHPEISGNKWRKLKYNIEEVKMQGKTSILTFGGAFSNHITATAAAGKYTGLKTIGIIRGEEHFPLNNSLQFAENCGMHLYYLDRYNYRNKNYSSIVKQLTSSVQDIYTLPEGGANQLALKGCAEIVSEINIDFDYIVSACGTGTTLAGMASNLQPHQKAIGIVVLKHDKLTEEIQHKFGIQHSSLSIQPYAFGGYAKTTPALINFINDFHKQHSILLDYVYTGKMMYAIFDLISQGYFPENSTIIAIHTGGVMNANIFEM